MRLLATNMGKLVITQRHARGHSFLMLNQDGPKERKQQMQQVRFKLKMKFPSHNLSLSQRTLPRYTYIMYFQYIYNMRFDLMPYIFCWQPEQGIEAPRTKVVTSVAPLANEVAASFVSAANKVPPKKNLPKRKRGER